MWDLGRGYFLVIGCACQLVLTYFCPLVIAMILSTWLKAPDSVVWLILDYVIFGLTSSALALSVFGLIPEAAEGGRWIWSVPVGLLVYSVAWDMSVGQFDSAQTILFGAGEDGWIRLFVTLPAWGCCWYSATMAWRRRRRNRSFVGAGNEV